MFLVFKFSKANDKIVIISAVVSFILGYLLKTEARIPFSADVCLIAYPMLVFGYYLKPFLNSVKKQVQLVIMFVSLVVYFALPIIYKLVNGQFNYINMFESKYASYFYDMITAYVGTLAFFLFFKYVKMPKFINWFGKNTIFYYAFHLPACSLVMFLLKNYVNIIFDKDFLKLSLEGSLIYGVVTVFSLLLITPLCFFVNRYIPILVGQKRKK